MKDVSSRTSASERRRARAEAAAWIVRLHGPHRTPVLEAAFRDWLSADEQNGQQFERVTEIWDTARNIPAGGMVRLSRWSPRGATHAGARATFIVVACAIASAFVGYRFWHPDRYRTGIVGQRVVRLQDGSSVSLNSDTGIRVEFTRARRRVILTKGEAYFEVAHNPNWPFVVTAGRHDVTALGTRFLVRHERNYTSITLVEGKVTVTNAALARVASPQIRGRARRRGKEAFPAAGGEQAAGQDASVQIDDGVLTLAPGERLVLAANSAPRIDYPRIDSVTAWMRGEVLMDNTPLGDAIAEMNRYEGEKIVIDTPDIGRLRVSGIYHKGDSAGFAEMIAKLYGLESVEKNNQIHLRARLPRDAESAR